MKQYMYSIITSILLGTLSSCNTSIEEANTVNDLVQISTRVSAYSRLESPGDNKYDDLTAYFFVDDMLTEKRAVTSDTLSASINKKRGNKVYFITNSTLFKELASLKVGSPVADFLSARTEVSTENTGAKMFMASSLDLNSAEKKQTVDLIRGVARLDITIADPGISISGVHVKNTIAESSLWPGSISKPTTTSYTKAFEKPITVAIPGVFYLYEHSDVSNCTVEVDITTEGYPTTARATLPKTITRNTVYEVAVKGLPDHTVSIELNIKEWGIGGTVDAIPD